MDVNEAATLTEVAVGDVKGEFFIPDYQRGYRWGEHEVRKLLDDIQDAQGVDYYLQPVVVKPLAGERWELVDGQQRLTTLHLLLRIIKDYLPQTELAYSMSYETREGSATFLNDPQEELSRKNIDYFHMFEAFSVIKRWFSEQSNANRSAIRLYEALTSSVYLIWYEAPTLGEADSRALFTRLNVGRIPLTDAELVKASLLSGIARPHETAAQWDTIERDLHEPEVWAFATGSSKGPATRIELILDTIADAINGHSPRFRPAFYTFETLKPLIESDPEQLWNRVVDLHSQVLGWYDDRDLFHKIGYLVAARRKSFRELTILAEDVTKTSFQATLDGEIAKSLDLSWHGVAALTYQSKKTVPALLLMNVETVRGNTNSFERYSFDAQARRQWSIEHIHAQNSEGLNSVEQWSSWLREHRDALDALDLDDSERQTLRDEVNAVLPTVSKGTFEPLHHKIVELFTSAVDQTQSSPEPDDRDEVDSIANLALLARDDNSALNNAVFEVKRRHIIGLDRRGSYVPVCTRNVFLKYYSGDGVRHLHYWSPQDRANYLAAMKNVLEPYLLEDVPENDAPDNLEDDET